MKEPLSETPRKVVSDKAPTKIRPRYSAAEEKEEREEAPRGLKSRLQGDEDGAGRGPPSKEKTGSKGAGKGRAGEDVRAVLLVPRRGPPRARPPAEEDPGGFKGTSPTLGDSISGGTDRLRNFIF